MSRAVVRGALAAAAVVAFAAACGGTSSESEPATTAAPATTRAETREAAPVDEACAEQLGPFVDSLTELHSRLRVGMSFQTYTELVDGIKAEYNRVPITKQSFECTSRVGVPAEDALAHYVAALDVWKECLADVTCSAASVDPAVQAHWREAKILLARAVENLAKLSGASR